MGISNVSTLGCIGHGKSRCNISSSNIHQVLVTRGQVDIINRVVALLVDGAVIYNVREPAGLNIHCSCFKLCKSFVISSSFDSLNI